MENLISNNKFRIALASAFAIVLIVCIAVSFGITAFAASSYTVSNVSATVTKLSNHSVITVTPADAELSEYSGWTFSSDNVDGDEAVLYDSSDSSWTLFSSLSTDATNPTTLDTNKLQVGLVKSNEYFEDGGTDYCYDWYIVISFRASGAKSFTNSMVVDGDYLIGSKIKLTELYAYNQIVRLDIVYVTYDDSSYDYSYYCNASRYVKLTDITEDTPTKTGYTFNGWYTDEACTQSYSSTVFTSDVTLYAGWTANEYTIVFNGNGNTSGSMSSLAMTYDVSKGLTTNAFVRKGYMFDGWATSATGSKEYSNCESVINLASEDGATVNLYAVWTATEYTITFNSNKPSDAEGSLTGTMTDQTFTYGIAQNLSANTYQLDGYTFKGWATSADAINVTYTDGQSVKDLTSDGESITLYAVWEVIMCKVTFIVDGSVWKEVEVEWGTAFSDVVSDNVSTALYILSEDEDELPN